MMSDALWMTVIAVAGGLVAVLGWKVLDIGKRAMELERRERDASVEESS
jgi:hypothetical protein